MRAKSNETDGYIIYAVSGTNTISFAIDFRNANTNGLLGFAVERINKATGKKKPIKGYKVFRDIIQNPTPETVVSTFDHPVQSFVWDDFTCYDNTKYEYLFHPVKGTPLNLDRNYNPISITISMNHFLVTWSMMFFLIVGLQAARLIAGNSIIYDQIK